MNVRPEWQPAFKSEISCNLRRLSNDFTRQLYIIDIRKECIMYACDMCLHYYKTGAFAGFLPNTIEDIAYNVCVAAHSLVKEFGESEWDIVINEVKNKLRDKNSYGNLQMEVNRYYNSF